ncbi:MAG: protein kinase [Gemmataceae bacterium]|nr:protein kinase [Gemmataceae bacterium]
MELVKKEGKLAPDAAVGYVLPAARGLRYGHHQGVVHRDIKPDDLMLNTEGLVKVADLGLVKIGNAELGMRNEDTPEEGPSDIPHSEFRTPHLTGAERGQRRAADRGRRTVPAPVGRV